LTTRPERAQHHVVGDEEAAMGKFVQIIEYTTTRKDEMDKLLDRWVEATEGKRTAARALVTSDRDKADTYVEIVEFPSYEDAMRNSQLPETDQFAGEMAKLCDGPMTFRNLDLIREESM
jgi:hypothetical protein